MTTQVRLQRSDADGLIGISAGDNGPQHPVQGPESYPVSVAVAVAGVLQPLVFQICNRQQFCF